MQPEDDAIISVATRSEVPPAPPFRPGARDFLTGVGWVVERLRAVGRRRLLLLAEALCRLLLARTALSLIPVRYIFRWQQRTLRQRRDASVASSRAAREEVRWAAMVVSRYSPVEFVCFPQCLAASAMLRQRGIASRLHYGVARQGTRLVTHTWLEADGDIVVGGEVAGGYAVLGTYAPLHLPPGPEPA